MVTVFCALYCESEEIISHYQLHKDNSNSRFQVFADLDGTIRVVITGVGAIAAATAVGSTAERYSIGKEDMLLNFGVCAGVNVPCGDLYLCSKLTELETGRTFYPDMLYRHPFGEAALVTGRNMWTGIGEAESASEPAAPRAVINSEEVKQPEARTQELAATLYDMEAAAIYQAASYYVGPHRMQFLKLVSDNGTGSESDTDSNAEMGACIVGQEHNTRVSYSTPAAIRQLIQIHEPEIFVYIDQLIALTQQETKKTKSVSPNDNPWFERLCADLHCSKVMGDELRQQLYYQELSGNCYETILQGMYEEGLLPCKDKREGKKCLEELKRRFL
jgi:nucleoside phosphorylase